MTRPYSEDLRERALLRADAGETIREIAAALLISPSCVSQRRKQRRGTGALTPGQMGGTRSARCRTSGPDWLRARIAAGPFTSRGLTAELAARGIKTDRRAVWTFLKAKGLSFTKNRAADGAVTSGHCLEAGALEGASAQD